jgi:hypothetical protein
MVLVSTAREMAAARKGFSSVPESFASGTRGKRIRSSWIQGVTVARERCFLEHRRYVNLTLAYHSHQAELYRSSKARAFAAIFRKWL